MKKQLIIDYRNENGRFVRKTVDSFEFCIREGIAYFTSNGEDIQVDIEDISQMYTA